jgi:hypothetical protein
MKRRTALKNMALLTGGIVLFPSCDFTEDKITILLQKLQIPLSQQTLIEEMVDTIIPEGSLPGAKSLKVQVYIWGTVGECMSEEDLESYLNGLGEFNMKYNQDDAGFAAHNPSERLKLLRELTKNIKKGDGLQEFIQTTKKLTIEGYMKSQYFMTEIMPYQLIPKKYQPCATVDTTQKINTNA